MCSFRPWYEKDLLEEKSWACEQIAVLCPLYCGPVSGSVLLLQSKWQLWFLTSEVAGEIMLENFRLRFPEALVINAGM